jgi:HK97 family phage major capsid protein
MNIEQLTAKRETLLATARELASGDGDLAQVKSIMAEAKNIEERVETIKSLGASAPVVTPAVDATPWKGGINVQRNPFNGSVDEKNLKAYTFGQFARHLAGVKSATKWLQSNGHMKAQNEGTDTAGGFTVPNIVSSDLIYLREMYGVARRNSRIYPMSSDTLLVPSATGSTTVYYASEATAITDSQLTFAQVSLSAKKLAVLTIASKELGEDTVIDLGAALARDMAYAIAKEEDNACFNGDGTSTYGSITGILQAVYGLNATKANIAGVVLGAALSGAAFSNFTLANFQSMVAKLPTYADNAKWYMHKDLFFNGVADKLIALGGNAILDIQNAYTQAPTLFGYPIEWVQNMPKSPAATTPVAILGDLTKGVAFGDRRAMTVEVSDQVKFVEDALTYKATERFAFNAHDVGNVNATASSRVPGSLIVLATTTAS